MPSRASLPTASLWMTAIVVLLLVNAPAFTNGTEWCRPESRSPHDWTCLDADSSFPTCCPPGSVCRSAVCVPIPSVSSDLAEPTSTDWYAPCFYPNGDLEPKDMPCSSQGGACCPGRWQCLSNGLCYNEFRYERHTCTDQAWGPSCPQVCDMQNSFSGNASEDIFLCDTNDTQVLGCCNGKAGGSGSCCDSGTASSFSLASGTVVASLGDTPSAWESFLRSSVRTTSISTSSATSTFTTFTSNSNGVVSTIVSTAFITAAPTYSTASSIHTSTAPVSVGNATSESSKTRPTTTILGTSIGVPLGLVALVAVFMILRRHRKSKAPGGRIPEIYFPPDPIYHPATKVLPRVELDAQSKAIHELDGKVAASQPGSSTPAVVHSKEPSTAVYELDATPRASPEPSNRISAVSTAYEPRLSNVSSLVPPVQHNPTAAGAASTPSRLQVVTHQHYGPAHSQFLIPESLYRLDRPLSGTLPAVQAAESELSSTPMPTASGERSRSAKSSHEGKTTHEEYESKQAMPKESHEAVNTTSEGAKTDNGMIPDEVSRTEGDDNANEAEEARAGKSE